MMDQYLDKGLFLLADKGYDSKKNTEICKRNGITPVIARNKRRSKLKPKRPRYYILLKKFRYLIEQSNSLLKKEILQGYWIKVKGFNRKAALVYSGIIVIQVMGINTLINDNMELLKLGKYR